MFYIRLFLCLFRMHYNVLIYTMVFNAKECTGVLRPDLDLLYQLVAHFFWCEYIKMGVVWCGLFASFWRLLAGFWFVWGCKDATWPQANGKYRPSVPTALQTVQQLQLARIVAVAHSGVTRCQQADAIRLKYKGFQLISYPNARTTSG
jgi:hypothetical protein